MFRLLMKLIAELCAFDILEVPWLLAFRLLLTSGNARLRSGKTQMNYVVLITIEACLA